MYSPFREANSKFESQKSSVKSICRKYVDSQEDTQIVLVEKPLDRNWPGGEYSSFYHLVVAERGLR